MEIILFDSHIDQSVIDGYVRDGFTYDEAIEASLADKQDVLDDLRLDLSVIVDGQICLIGSLKRWNGIFDAAKLCGRNLSDIINCHGMDEYTIYLDTKKRAVIFHGTHHDGWFDGEYRLIKTGRESHVAKAYACGIVSDSLKRNYTNGIYKQVKELLKL